MPEVLSFRRRPSLSGADSIRMGVFGKIAVEVCYKLAQKSDRLTIEIEYWMDMKTVSVPFDLTTPLRI